MPQWSSPSTTQLRALVELARGSRLLISDRACVWTTATSKLRAGGVRMGTAQSLMRAGWIEPAAGAGMYYQISEAGRHVAAGLGPGALAPAGSSKVGLAPVDLLRALEKRHPFPAWVLATEVEIGLGERRRVDVLAVSGIEVIAYELKVSRSDFERELKDPRKRARAMELASSFYFCAPVGLINIIELPPRTGLMEVHALGGSHVEHNAERKEPERPDWPLVAAILRAAATRWG
jgi:hypothetical protein